MKYLVPVQHLINIACKNKKITILLFCFCYIISIFNGYIGEKKIDPSATINFLNEWSGIWKDIMVSLLKFISTPIGSLIWISIVFILFMLILYFFSGVKKREKFVCFAFNLVSLCYFGAGVMFISFIAHIFSYEMSYMFKFVVYLYWLLFYIMLLIERYEVKIFRSIVVNVLSYVLLFPLGGFPIISPYLQWM